MQFRIGKVEGKGIDIAFTDGTRKELPAFSVTGAHFLAQDVTGPGFGRMPFEFNARFGKEPESAPRVGRSPLRWRSTPRSKSRASTWRAPAPT